MPKLWVSSSSELGAVGKRSKRIEAEAASDRGLLGSENADISNDKHG
jgi:hypothetical protein